MSRLLQDILNQPQSLRDCIDHQFGPGRIHLQNAAPTLISRGAVILTGMGSSLYAGYPLAVYLASRGIQPLIFDTSELLHFNSRLLDLDLPVVLISRSGETVEILSLLERLRGRRRTIGVSNVSDSPLITDVDYPILMGCGTDQLVAIQTYAATIPVLLALGRAAFGELDHEWRSELEALLDPLETLTRDCEKRSQALRDFLKGANPVHLLGRGASMASALEGGLLFNEVAKHPAVAMSAGNFRHGPVEIVDSSFSAFLFATQPETRDLDLALARDLRKFGGDVQVVTSDHNEEACPEPAWKIPPVSGLLAPILEIVPVQLVTLRLAEWRGVTPGEFRYAGPVTRSEEHF